MLVGKAVAFSPNRNWIEMFPNSTTSTMHTVRVDAGECLIIPALWWHEVSGCLADGPKHTLVDIHWHDASLSARTISLAHSLGPLISMNTDTVNILEPSKDRSHSRTHNHTASLSHMHWHTGVSTSSPGQSPMHYFWQYLLALCDPPDMVVSPYQIIH